MTMLKQLFDAQMRQQIDLGLDPKHMDDHERLVMARRVMLGIHEEATELQQLTTSYKRHILKAPEINRENIADECADLVKWVITMAQMFGVDADEFRAAFDRKTHVVKARAAFDRFKLKRGDKVVCVDLDDVVCDLGDWQAKLKGIGASIPDGDDKLRVLEEFKERFYRRGGFRDLVPVPGAKPALTRLSEAGFSIVMITARPADQYKRLFADTLAWLAKHRMPHDKVVFNKDKLEAVHQHIVPAWPTAFVEDHPKNALTLAAASVPVLLFDRPHNRVVDDGDHLHRVGGWSEVMDRIFSAEAEDEEASQHEYAASIRNG
jgi:NTP pyrophosphatase (non-canonical NTP hydrolase)